MVKPVEVKKPEPVPIVKKAELPKPKDFQIEETVATPQMFKELGIAFADEAPPAPKPVVKPVQPVAKAPEVKAPVAKPVPVVAAPTAPIKAEEVVS